MTNEETGRLILQAHTGLHGDVAKKLADALAEQLAEVTRQQQIIDEVHSWIVCAPIATPDDMMQNAQRIIDITGPKDANAEQAVEPHYRCHYDDLTGDDCSVCGKPQFMTPSGVTCQEGHGGAEPKKPQ